MKKCSKCKQEKEYEGFYKDKTAKDGFNGICKKCRLEMDRNRRRNDPDWVEKRYKQNSEFHKKNKESIAERKKKWLSSEKGKISHYASSLKYRDKYPEKRKAHDAVYQAIKRKELYRPEYCQICNAKSRTEAHHASYDSERRSSIIWICRPCHQNITNKKNSN